MIVHRDCALTKKKSAGTASVVLFSSVAALLAGIAPAQVEDWYLSVYADAFEWAELPNTHGMALHADGGVLASKPYAASGAYIDRMSDYCSGCAYGPKVKIGPKTCPFNYLYWHFLIVSEARLKSNPRMAMPYRTLARMTDERRRQIMQQAQEFLARLESEDRWYDIATWQDLYFSKKERRSMESQQAPQQASRSLGALYGLYLADALAMPVHWYYDRQALFRDYGWVADYLAPKNPHPDSILWRSSYSAPNKKGEILHDQACHWGKRGIHYHQFLQSGENTLNLQLCSLLIESLNENGRYDPADYLKRYIRFMTTPGMHRDTYIEECHRHFFSRYALGFPPEKCGALEKHIGGLPGIVPLVVYYQENPRTAYEAAMSHLALTHKGPHMEEAGRLLIHLLLDALEGEPLKQVILDSIQQQRSPLLGHPFHAWLKQSDESVVGGHLSTACYVEDSVPAAIYLALKYADQPEQGLIVNTNLGGDNAYRGAVLGALLGAANGLKAFPEQWIRGLVKPPPQLELGVRR